MREGHQKDLSNSPFASIKLVVDSGACVGCGNCAFVANGNMSLSKNGEYSPVLAPGNIRPGYNEDSLIKICPSLHPTANETAIADRLFSHESFYDSRFGRYSSIWGGFTTVESIRHSGTSGGLTTWFACTLLDLGLITGVIHIHQQTRAGPTSPFFRYGISNTIEDIQTAAKTRYHVMEMSEVLDFVNKTPGKYLFIGVPCFAKAIRRLQAESEILNDRIAYVAALICGHYKSINWSILLGWSAGIHPSDLSEISYRVKGEGILPRNYFFQAKSRDGRLILRDSAAVAGGKFNAGAMMLDACRYCDDVVGETADITFGDAWIPRFEADRSGTNLVIARTAEISRILENAVKLGQVQLSRLSPDEVVAAQSGAFRQRSEGLSFRLAVAQSRGIWTPTKRVAADLAGVPYIRRGIYLLRDRVTSISKVAFVEALESNDLRIYVRRLRLWVLGLRTLEISSSLHKSIRRRLLTIFYQNHNKH